MTKYLLVLSLLFVSFQSVYADDTPSTSSDLAVEQPVDFRMKKWSQLQWRPSIYPADGATYDVFYYIPRVLKRRAPEDGYPALIFLHGGGASTTSPQGSIGAIKLYKDLLIQLADKLDIAVVLPSGTGMNWGTHTPYYMRSLIKMMRNSLNVNPDKIGISGHSMGGMAMTRIFYEVADQVAFILPLAAGLAEPSYLENLSTHFNTPYYHIQGRKDHFDTFISRCEVHANNVKKLEDLYGQKSKFTMEFTDDDHSSVLKKLIERTKMLFESPRDLFQTKLYGHWWPVPLHTEVDVGQKITLFPRVRYYWVEALELSNSPLKTISFVAEVKENIFQIKFNEFEQTPKKLRVFLSSKMVDLNQAIQVYVNGKLVATRAAAPAPEQIPGKTIADLYQDQGMQFEDKIDIQL